MPVAHHALHEHQHDMIGNVQSIQTINFEIHVINFESRFSICIDMIEYETNSQGVSTCQQSN